MNDMRKLMILSEGSSQIKGTKQLETTIKKSLKVISKDVAEFSANARDQGDEDGTAERMTELFYQLEDHLNSAISTLGRMN